MLTSPRRDLSKPELAALSQRRPALTRLVRAVLADGRIGKKRSRGRTKKLTKSSKAPASTWTADLAAKAIEAEIEARKSADALILAEEGRWWTAAVRPLLALPVVIYLWKVIVWDKVLGLGTTDAIAGDVAQWAGAIVTTYVGGRSLEKIAKSVATVWRRGEPGGGGR
jgi:hypothetical protein